MGQVGSGPRKIAISAAGARSGLCRLASFTGPPGASGYFRLYRSRNRLAYEQGPPRRTVGEIAKPRPRTGTPQHLFAAHRTGLLRVHGASGKAHVVSIEDRGPAEAECAIQPSLQQRIVRVPH